MEKEKLIAFADDMELLLERKADASKTVNESYKGFVEMEENSGIKLKALKKAVVQYLKWKNDKNKLLEEMNDTDLLFGVLTGEIDNSI